MSAERPRGACLHRIDPTAARAGHRHAHAESAARDGISLSAFRPVVARASSALPVLAWSLILVGGFLRVARYAEGRSLWYDEAAVALNIVDRPYSALFGRLDFQQGAPPGFLLAEKLAVEILGRGEYALRLLPLLFALASLPLFHALARRLLPPAAATLALALFALSEPLVRYSAQLKQYSTDVAFALALALLALSFLTAQPSVLRTAGFAATGLVAVWFSHASLFVLTAAALSLAAVSVTRRQRTQIVHLGAALAVWLAGFLCVYLIALRHLEGSAHVFVGHRYAMPFPPTSREDLRWFAGTGAELLGRRSRRLGRSSRWSACSSSRVRSRPGDGARPVSAS